MKKLGFTLLIPFVLAGCATNLTANQRSQLAQQLKDMAAIDQIAAYIPQGKYKQYTKPQWEAFKDSVFTANKAKTEQLFKRYGFLGFDQVGKEGATHFWLLVQHFDNFPAFQRRVLKAMDRNVKSKNADPNNYAYLYDRVQVNAGEKRLFGTQVTYEVQTTGRAIPKNGLLDSLNVNKRRSEYGLSALKDYLNEMTSMHFEMNKSHYEKMGLTKPNLYR